MDITGEVCWSFGQSLVRPSHTKKGRFVVMGGLSVFINQRIEIGDEDEVN